MTAHYSILGLQKLNTIAQIEVVSRHNHRQRDVANADPKRRAFNRTIIGSTSIVLDYRKRMAEMCISESDVRKNAVRAVELVLAFSPNWLKQENGLYVPDAREKLQAWLKLSTQWLNDSFGKNVLSLILHGDESNYHLHCVCAVGYWNERWQKYRLSADRFFGSPSKLRALHTSYAKKLEPIGLQRGRENSTATHQTLREFYIQLNEATVKANKLGLVGPADQNPATFKRWEHSLAVLSDDVENLHAQRELALQNELAYWKAKCRELQAPSPQTLSDRTFRPTR